jgi:hypothetical protein
LPGKYFQLQPCQQWRNWGPPFQIDNDAFHTWYAGALECCPLMLHTLVSFLQPYVKFSKHRVRPISREELQPNLHVHVTALLSASPVTSKMTIETALTRLARYAKVLCSDVTLVQVGTFVEQMVCLYLIGELLRVCEQFDKVRLELRLKDECCEDVLNRADFSQRVAHWRGVDPHTRVTYSTSRLPHPFMTEMQQDCS